MSSSTIADSNRKLQNRALWGVFLMIGGIALYAISDAFIKHLMGLYSLEQTTMLRSVTRLVPLLIATFFQGGPLQVLNTDHPLRHLIRLGVNLAYTISFMYAFKLASLTTIYTISYTSPFFMIILSAFLLKERPGWEKWLAIAIGMAGVVVAMRPGTSLFEWAAMIVLLGSFLGSLNKILMRRLAATEHSLAIAIYPNLMMILVAAPFVFFSWKAMPWEHWGLFAFVGLITAGGQYAIAQALRNAQASVLAPIDYSSFFWVVSLDYFWWNRPPALHMLAGAAIIVASNCYILYRARVEQAKKGVLTAAK